MRQIIGILVFVIAEILAFSLQKSRNFGT